MKKVYFRRLLYLIVVLLIVILGVFIWADNELNKVLGKSTKEITISSIVRPSNKIIGIKNVNILSEDCNSFIPNQDVIIKNNVILQIGKSQLQDSTIVTIDGTNKFLIPGLIDSHVHLKESKNDLYLYLANGVTSVREMAGSTELLQWRKSIQKEGIGPRMLIASPPIFSESGFAGYYYSWTRHAINYSTNEDAKKAIRKIKEQGYDAIKMYGFVNPEMFKTTIEMAKASNIPVIGHLPLVGLEEFYTSGQIEVAHIEELTVKTIDEFGKSIPGNPKEYLQFLKVRSDQIAKKLKKNNISVTSTVWLCESFLAQRFDLKNKLKEVQLQYANPKIIEGTPLYKLGWLPGKNGYEYDGSNEANAKKRSRIFWQTYVEAIHIMTKALVANKVTIMAGTDANVATVVPGFSLHDELVSLSKTGMSNSQVLYAATVAPGNWMKTKTGKIKTGYRSDLILLAKNPLEDIENTKTIDYVFFDQYRINKSQINNILNAVEKVNNKNRTIKIDEFL
ncbi:hypothetical protein B4N84_15085 [Flavobacterium sp. IR1]|nr:hypothetical protein B4N84_15085 [Flavobacterium sp. IR1]